MKTLLLFLLQFVAINYLKAQTDSLAVSKAKWQRTKLAPGILLKEYQFTGNLFSSQQYISIVEVAPRTHNRFKLAYEKQILRKTSDFGKANKAVAALNGSFFDVTNGGSVDYVKVDGHVISISRPEKDSTRARHQQAAIAISHGKLSLEKWDGTANWEQKLTAENILLTGPLLIYHNQNVLADTSDFARLRHPRTAIAIKGKRVLLITVDGRNDHAAGMSLSELEKLIHWFHAGDGINLDGGGSTTLWVNGREKTGVINHPSDNKEWDHEGERKVANAILLIR